MVLSYMGRVEPEEKGILGEKKITVIVGLLDLM
jgi:hypothetical protein